MNTDSRVDAYIAKAPSFAQPILKEVRARIRKACPAAEETIKWNVPFYLVGGKFIASMAAFKKHAKIGVWREMMPTFVDVTSVSELPSAKQFAQSVAASAEHARDASASSTKKSSTKKSPTKKSPTKKSPTKKSPTKKSPTKKSAAKSSRSAR